MHKFLIAALPLSLALAACTPVAEPDGPAAPGQCREGGYDQFIGQNEEIFARATFPAPMRIIRPGDAVTMDFNPDRLNFRLDASGTIVEVFCG
ncbi:I78 family peptidase inhibitor [Roseobacter sp. HKCCA0434]|uniref:I78 family peptidase inhibitor n=1 Tax=Roseobacter sp. HKCCA0434 TaxID=3079297 RepID=UPI002905CE9F|nr:I78 family peptidase inhibitor [Roseobacter sp. HKCCA0434]